MKLGQILGDGAQYLRDEQARRDEAAARKRAGVARACKAREEQRKRAQGRTIRYQDDA